MSKSITANQLLGEEGEAAVNLRFVEMGFQFDRRGRLEAGIDGIAEIMDNGAPLARMIAVQVKATDSARYVGEDEGGFSYLVRPEDLAYWRPSNLPVILVLYRRSDRTLFWKEVDPKADSRKLRFNKAQDVLNRAAKDRLAALTVSKEGFGHYVPPLGEGEEALINMLPVQLPAEIFVASTPYTPQQAIAVLFDSEGPVRFDWTIQNGTFWSFADPRTSICRHIVDADQVEAIDTAEIAYHEDNDELNNMLFLLRKTLDHQVRNDLVWNKDRKLFYFRALAENKSRTFTYDASKKKASTEVVNVSESKTEKGKIGFVRHHAFIPRFERLYDEWYLVINPTYFFTTNGIIPHSFPAALLAGKKRLDNSASLRGQVVMWHRFLSKADRDEHSLFADQNPEPRLKFGEPPVITLEVRVPEDVWGAPKKQPDKDDDQEQLFG